MTITRGDGRVVARIAAGSSGSVTLRSDRAYRATVWQTDTSVDDFEAELTCESSAAPTSEPTQDPTASPVETTTTLAPTIAPTYEICDTNDSLNIGILMDESGSVSSSEWDVMVDFVKRIATYDFAGPSYVSLWEFASLVAFDQFLDFTPVDDDRSGITTVTNALDSNSYNAAGTTETWDAVNRVLDDFWHYRKNCTDGCDTRDDILFLFTDGAPTTMSGYAVCPELVPRATSTSVDIVIVAVGESEDDIDEWLANVTCLVTDQDVFKVTEFTEEAFRTLEGRMRNKTCNGLHPAGASDRGGSAWVYDDGSTGLGPVPTASGDGNAPVDPNAFGNVNFGQAMQALLNHEEERDGYGTEENQVEYEDVEISLSPSATMNLWAMAILAVFVNGLLIVWCTMRRKRYAVETMEKDYVDNVMSDQFVGGRADRDHLVETEVDF